MSKNPPLRESLHRLADEGLVRIVPRVGYFVSKPTIEKIQELFEVRRLLEGMTAELAAQRATAGDLVYLRSLVASVQRGGAAMAGQHPTLNREFHVQVALTSKNSSLAEIVASLLDKMEWIHYLLLNVGPEASLQRVTQEHMQLLDAIEARDPAAARREMIDAIGTSQELTLTFLSDSQLRRGVYDEARSQP